MRTLKIGLVLLMTACASAVSGTAMPDAGNGESGCTFDTDCATDTVCRDGYCRAPEEIEPDAGNNQPHLIVTPTELDFGAAFLGDEVALMATIANVGALLHISRITVEQDGAVEFSAVPSGEVDITLAIAGLTTVTVTLLPTDAVEDHGNLVIESNDPETPVLRIPLTSELKGDPEVSVCVLSEGWTDRFNDCEFDDEVHFSIFFGDSATRYITLWNTGTDNRPLEITAINFVDADSSFDLEVLDRGEDPVEFPVLLSAPSGSEEPDYLTLRVNFTGTLNTYASGALEEITDTIRVESNYEAHPQYDILLRARVACLPGCSGAICDVCCTPSYEFCDGVDNDCDGVVDNPPEVPGFVWCGDIGVCADTPIVCTADGGFECDFPPTRGPETCDGLDNDCNGETDEGGLCIPPPTACVDMNVRSYEGTCRGADGCEYSITDTPCGAPEHSIATCESATCGFECDEGYEGCGGECCILPWVPTAVDGAPSARTDHIAFWTGSEMIVWGGYDGSPEHWGYASTGGRYDPTTDTWSTMADNSDFLGYFGGYYRVVSTGSEIIVWGGTNCDGPVCVGTNSGKRYNPTTDTWITVSTENAPAARQAHTAVWTGSEMIVWGGYDYHPETTSYERFSGGGRYDPTADEWILFEAVGAPEGRVENSVVWTGEEMLVWGGFSDIEGGVRVNTGRRYNPITNSWSTIAVIDAPSIRRLYTATWTGTEMIVWGGCASESCDAHLNSGAHYNPTTDAWIPTTIAVDVPTARREHTAIWTGSEMIVWGGNDGVVGAFATGGHYDPIADSWRPTFPLPIAWNLRAHTRHTAIWTGSEMIVWGGGNGAGPTNTGARYTP